MRSQHGNAVLVALIGLVGAIGAALIGKGCTSETHDEAALASPSAPAPVFEPLPASSPQPGPPDSPKVATLSVYNPCSQPLLIAFSHESEQGERMNVGFFQVDPGAIITPSGATGPIYLHEKSLYFYTETIWRAPVETGQRQEVIGGKQVGMKRVTLDPPAVTAINLECPAAPAVE